jgi:hypothetical protein
MRLTSPEAARAWGCVPWLPGKDEALVHPDDREALTRLRPHGRLMAHVGDVDGYLVVAEGDARFRIRPALWIPCSAPSFVPGQPVHILAQPERAAVVAEVWWHSRDARPFYFLNVGGRRSSRRYFDAELTAATP